jgi:hypothetical protein
MVTGDLQPDAGAIAKEFGTGYLAQADFHQTGRRIEGRQDALNIDHRPGQIHRGVGERAIREGKPLQPSK